MFLSFIQVVFSSFFFGNLRPSVVVVVNYIGVVVLVVDIRVAAGFVLIPSPVLARTAWPVSISLSKCFRLSKVKCPAG